MARLISWLIMIPLAVVVVAFTIANRGPAELDLWPMPVQLDVPLFSLVLAGGFAGFFAGAMIVWLTGGRKRTRFRQLVRQLETAKAEEKALRKRMDELERSRAAPVPVAIVDHSKADAA